MENENLRNIENLLAAKASTQPLYEFPVDQLPLGLRDSLSGVAAEARVPALFSALPIAATYADRLKAKYCDGSDTPMALMSIIIGEQASGKGVCRRIENIWAKKMDKDDEKPREDEAWYQQHKGKKGVVDPKPCIRHIGDTISKSALMRRQLPHPGTDRRGNRCLHPFCQGCGRLRARHADGDVWLASRQAAAGQRGYPCL